MSYNFLSKELRAFLIVISKAIFGLALVVLAAFMLLSILSYNVTDSSLNTFSIEEGVNNWMGRPGAYTADILLQYMGISSLLLIAFIIFWGVVLIKRIYIYRKALRLEMFLLGLPLFAASLDYLVFMAGIEQSNIAGVLGTALNENIFGTFYYFEIPVFITVIVAIVVFFASLFAIGYGLKIRRKDLKSAIHFLGTVGYYIYYYLVYMGFKIEDFLAKVFRKKQMKHKVNWENNFYIMDEQGLDVREKFARLIAARRGEDLPINIPKHAREIKQVIQNLGNKKKGSKREATEKQPVLFSEGPALPPLNLLAEFDAKSDGKKVNEESLVQNAKILESCFAEFGVSGKILKVRPGPVVTLYELEPAAGTKTSKVVNLSEDIARSMSALSVRIAHIPGRNVIGIEMPNIKRESVSLRDMLSRDEFNKSDKGLLLALGKDIGGDPVYVDLASMPHMLVAGTTGSGKSVAINTMIMSLLYRLTPDRCRFIMIDPKMLELSVYDGIPHLLTPVVVDASKAIVALKWAVREMENRYKNMSKLGVRNLDAYNARIKEAVAKGEVLKRTVQTGFDEAGKPIFEEQPIDMKPVPYIVVIVDEMADLMLVAGKEVEAAIQRLAQMARAAGIHLIMATQRPSVDVITGTIKANFPTRVSFQVTSKIDSRTILGEQGAEQLLGKGDMLYMAAGGKISRVHGPFVSDKEVEAVVNFLKSQGEPEYVEEVTKEEMTPEQMALLGGGDDDGGDEGLYRQAVEIVLRDKKASTSYIQRMLRIGYNRAANIIDRMEREGIISKANHVGKREVLDD